MTKFKNTIHSLFETPKKRAITIICAIAVLSVLGITTVFAANAIAQSTSIGEENAKNYAYADAGVDPVSAQNVHVEFDFEQGQFVYEVEFTADNTEYEYWIKASDGSVVKKSLELTSLDDTGTTASDSGTAAAASTPASDSGAAAAASTPASDSGTAAAASTPASDQTQSEQSDASTAYIGIDKAKSIAAEHAGFSVSELSFSKAKLENDDGITVYEVEFYKNGLEYEYTIDASSGTILEYETDWDD